MFGLLSNILLSTLASFLHVLVVTTVLYIIYYLWDRQRSLQRVGDTHKKCVFISGCDSGFGRALARSLDSKGVPVFAGCLTDSGAKELQAASSSRLQTVPLNVTDPESVKKAAVFVEENLQPGTELWGLVNNAGVLGDSGPVEFLARSDYEKIFDVNFYGMLEMTSSFLPFIKKSRGRIVNIATVLRYFPVPGLCPYTASKWALAAISEALRVEKAPWGIKVSTLFPGGFKTNIFSKENYVEGVKKQWERLPQSVKDDYGEEYLAKCVTPLDSKDTPIKVSDDLNLVVEAYDHALFAAHPRSCYTVGKDAKAMRVLSAVLPQFLLDKIAYATIKRNVPLAVRRLQTTKSEMVLLNTALVSH